MLRNGRKLLSVLLALVMVLGLLPLSAAPALAADEEEHVLQLGENPVSTDRNGTDYTFTPEEDGAYRIFSSSEAGIDPAAQLYQGEITDEDGYFKEDDDTDSGSNSLDFSLIATLRANQTYTLKIWIWNENGPSTFNVIVEELDAEEITIDAGAGGNVEAYVDGVAVAKAADGQMVYLKVAPEAGYALKSLAVKTGSGDDAEEVGIHDAYEEGEGYSAFFFMPDDAVTVTPVFQKGYTITAAWTGGPEGTAVFTHDVKVYDGDDYDHTISVEGDAALNYTVTSEESVVEINAQYVTIRSDAPAGYYVSDVTVACDGETDGTDENGNVDLYGDRFEMPAGNVTVTFTLTGREVLSTGMTATDFTHRFWKFTAMDEGIYTFRTEADEYHEVSIRDADGEVLGGNDGYTTWIKVAMKAGQTVFYDLVYDNGEEGAPNIPVTILVAPLEPVDYIDENGETKTCSDYTPLTAELNSGDMKPGWYVASGEVELGYLDFDYEGDSESWDYYLILADGAVVTAGCLYCDGTLTIYGQKEGTGSLTVDLTSMEIGPDPDPQPLDGQIEPLGGLMEDGDDDDGDDSGDDDDDYDDDFGEFDIMTAISVYERFAVHGGVVTAEGGNMPAILVWGKEDEAQAMADDSPTGNKEDAAPILITGGQVTAISDADLGAVGVVRSVYNELEKEGYLGAVPDAVIRLRWRTGEEERTNVWFSSVANDVTLERPYMDAKDNETAFPADAYTAKVFNTEMSGRTLVPVPPFTVTFLDEDGKTKLADAQTVDYGGKAAKPDPEPTKEGYTFAGWYLDDAAFDFDTQITADLALLGKWTINTYTVTFLDEDGETKLADAQTVDHGGKAAKPAPEPTKKGHTFAGWYLDEKAYDFDTQITADLTLLGKWTINSYTVTFLDEDGETKLADAQTVAYGEKAAKPDPEPVKKGHTFAGWYLGDAEFDFATSIEEDLTLTAKWTVNTYTVTFLDEDGKTTLADAQTVAYGEKAAKPDPEPAKEGYAFAGWYLGDTEFDFATLIEEDLTLKAKWTVNTYTVTFLDEDGETVLADAQTVDHGGKATEPEAPEKAGYDFSGWYDGETEFDFTTPVTADLTLKAKWIEKGAVTHTVTFVDGESETKQTVVDGESAAKPEDPVKEGHTFAGWFEENAEAPFDFTTPITADLTLIAKWTVNTYTVTFLDEDGETVLADAQTVDHGGKATEPEDAPAKDGYDFAGWYDGETEFDFATPITADLTLKAKWIEKGAVTHKVTFVDGESQTTQTVEDGKCATDPKPAKEGHTFAGWFEENAEGPFDFATPITADLTLTAKWTVNTYTVTFDPDNGEEATEVTVEEGKTVAEPEDAPAKDGYDFAGWYDNETEFDFATPITADLTLKAKWIEKGAVTHTVTFVDGESRTHQTVEDGKCATDPKPAKEGHTFAGWFEENAEGPFDFATPITTDLTLIAKWTAGTYTVTFVDEDGETVLETDEDVPYGGKPSYDGDTPVKAATYDYLYEFAGWDPEITEDTVVTGDVTYTAVYAPIALYTVSYDPNGGGGTMESDRVPAGDFKLPDCGFTAPENMIFDAWESSDGTGYKEGDVYTVTGDTVVKARWKDVGKSSGKSSNGPFSHRITIAETEHGTVRASESWAYRGDKIKLTVTPEDGWKLDKLVIQDTSHTDIPWTYEGNGVYTFMMVSTNVTVTATFAETDPKAEGGAGPENPYEDVDPESYYYDAVMWAHYADPQITNGMDATHFGPDVTTTRAHLVTFIWRAMGCPEPAGTECPFEDVEETDYFCKAVLWAVEQGIVKGTDATHFSPKQTCSTAHIVTMLYRALGAGTDGWYEEAAAWAEELDLLADTGLTVSPDVDCPRSVIVTLLYRTLGKK